MLNYLKHPDYKTSVFTGIIVGGTSVIVGAILSFTNIWTALGIVVSIGFIVWAFMRSEVALWATIIISCLIPFGTLPVKLIITPTLLDLTIIAIYLVFLAVYIPKSYRILTYTPVHIPIMVFILLSILSFILGLGNAAHPPNIIRKFTVFILNVGLSIIIVEQINEVHLVKKMLKIIVYSGFAAAAIGIALYFLPSDLSQQILNYFGVLNYPTGNVLRYIEDNP